MPIRAARQVLTGRGATRAGQSLGLAVLALLLGSQGLQNAVANGDTRTISLHHIHTGEDLTVTFKRNGRYDEEALKKVNHVLRDWRRDEETAMDPHLLDVAWEVYRDVDAKVPIQVVCGYRAPATNAMLRKRSRGVAQFSQHMLGRAMDFFIPGVPLETQREAGLRLQRGGVGYYPSSGSPFIHLDVGSVRYWPRMTRAQLAKVFPDGRTVHVPTDGHPLSGYVQVRVEPRIVLVDPDFEMAFITPARCRRFDCLLGWVGLQIFARSCQAKIILIESGLANEQLEKARAFKPPVSK